MSEVPHVWQYRAPAVAVAPQRRQVLGLPSIDGAMLAHRSGLVKSVGERQSS
jgi:hypothetical protein